MLLELPSECVLRILRDIPVADVVAIGSSCSALQALVADDAFWRDLAEAKWGSAVHELKCLADEDAQQRLNSNDSGAAACQASDQAHQHAAVCSGAAAAGACGPGLGNISSWHRYCCKRMCLKAIRASPQSLLQESYLDPWMHITCCVLCSRTSGSATIRDCIARFFEVFPSPTACLQGCPQAMASLLHPLGLTQARLAAVRAVAKGFLGTDWREPSEFKGCGKFVSDSWRIFCKGAREAKGVEDARLKQYLAWTVKQQQAGCNQHGTQELAAEEAAAVTSGRRRMRTRSNSCAVASKDSKGQQWLQQSTQAPTAQRRTRAQAQAAEAACAAATAAAAAAAEILAAAAASKHGREAGTTNSKKVARSRVGAPYRSQQHIRRSVEV